MTYRNVVSAVVRALAAETINSAGGCDFEPKVQVAKQKGEIVGKEAAFLQDCWVFGRLHKGLSPAHWRALVAKYSNRSPVGNPDLWEANKALRSKNTALADAYDANVDTRNASNTGRKKFKKLTQRERKENFYVDAKAAGKGYIGGTFRGSHMVSIGAPDMTVVENVDPSGRDTISKGSMLIRASGKFPVIYIQTNSPYGEMLELGHSTQAPGGVYDLAFIGVSEAYK